MQLQCLLTQRAQDLRKAGAEWFAMRAQYIGPASPELPDDSTQRVDDLAGDAVSDEALLAHRERVEEATLRHYRWVLDEELPILVRAVAHRHCDATRDQRAQLRSLHAAWLQEAPKAPHRPGSVSLGLRDLETS
jgi:hypothetical protein